MSGALPPGGAPPSPFDTPPDPMGAPPSNIISRDEPDPSEQRRKLVARWTDKVVRARAHFKSDFDRMKANTEFVLGAQWEDGKPLTGGDAKDHRYVANVALRHVQQAVASLYPNNPTVEFTKKEKLIATLWDGDMATLQAAQQKMAQNAQAAAVGLPQLPIDPETAQILQDFQAVQTYDKMVTRVGTTMQLLWDYNVDEQVHPFKAMMKLSIRRAVITGVAFVKLGFQRAMEMSPEIEQRIADMSEQLATIERISADIADSVVQADSADAEQLRIAIETLTSEGQIVVREGLTFDYPDSWAIIPDPKCRSLRGFLGADWVAQEYMLSVDEIEEIWAKDVRAGHAAYSTDENETRGNSITQGHTKAGGGRDDDDRGGMCCVWEIWSRKDGTVYTICDGYKDFLCEPHPPETYCDAFWPWHPIVMNEAYHAKRLFPLSDIDLMRDMQMEINRARQGLREQRMANRPAMAVAAGALEQADKDKIANRPANALLELNGLVPGQKVADLLQAITMPEIQQELYDTSGAMEDMLRVLGDQSADSGTTSGATATEASLAESSLHTAYSSIMDDLDDMLSSLARNGGQVLLLNVSAQIVNEVCGPGAVWPSLDKVTISKNVYLQVKAGSSGRPNKQQEVANLVQVIPLLQRIPGISPEWMAREILKRMDDRLDLTDAFVEGIPSIEAMNAQGGGPGGPPGPPPGLAPKGPPDAGGPNAPSAQGPQGQQNAQAGPPTNGLTRPRQPPVGPQTLPQPGQPLGVHDTKGNGPPTP